MSILDRFLPVWIIAAMVLGVVCGYYVPDLARKLSVVSIQGTSLPIALGLWLMMWPVLAKVRGQTPALPSMPSHARPASPLEAPVCQTTRLLFLCREMQRRRQKVAETRPESGMLALGEKGCHNR